MSRTSRAFVWAAGIFLAALMCLVGFGEHGLADLIDLRQQHQRLLEENRALETENAALLDEIRRLRSDPAYIELIARRKLGMIGRDELLIQVSPPAAAR